MACFAPCDYSDSTNSTKSSMSCGLSASKRLAQAVLAFDQQFLDRRILAAVQVRRGAPNFDQRWRIEPVGPAVFVPRTDIVHFQVGVQRRRMAAAAAGPLTGEQRLAPLGRRAQLPVHQVRTGDLFERLDVRIDRGCTPLPADRRTGCCSALPGPTRRLSAGRLRPSMAES